MMMLFWFLAAWVATAAVAIFTLLPAPDPITWRRWRPLSPDEMELADSAGGRHCAGSREMSKMMYKGGCQFLGYSVACKLPPLHYVPLCMMQHLAEPQTPEGCLRGFLPSDNSVTGRYR
jgi:hypothetical protein